MRKLNLEDFKLREGVKDTYEYLLKVWSNEFRFRIIWSNESHLLASVIYSVGNTYWLAKCHMEYVFNWVKDRKTAVKILNEFISKMIDNWKLLYNVMDKYEIHYK